MQDAQVNEIWQRITEVVMNDPSVGPTYSAQLSLAVPRGIGSGTLYLAVQLDFTMKLLDTRLREHIMRAITEVCPNGEVTGFVVMVDESAVPELPEVANETPAAAPEQPAASSTPGENTAGDQGTQGTVPAQTQSPWGGESTGAVQRIVTEPRGKHGSMEFEESPLNPKYTLDSFVVGEYNRLVYAAAIAVCEQPSTAYNPLFIYGGSGLGKTHLLHAIGHYSRKLRAETRVRYVNSEDFTNDFINAIQNNQGPEFHKRYRSVDLLLVDDIQFLAGKVETQEAFFHTFNTLHSHNKQVVITSDIEPVHLKGFEERMLSRFASGLIANLGMPSLETRIAILRKKAEREAIEIDNSVLEFIASNVNSNIRELEGTLIRVTANSRINQVPIDMQLVKTVLKSQLSLDAQNEIDPDVIIDRTASYFAITADEITGPSRAQNIAMPRQIAMYLCREMTDLSLPRIGELFSGRDHTTVMYAHKKISKLITERRSVYNQVMELTEIVKKA